MYRVLCVKLVYMRFQDLNVDVVVQFWYICMCRQEYLISWLNMIDHWDHAACCNIENLAQRENSMYQVPNRLFSLFSWFVVTLRLWLTFDTRHTWKMQKISNVLNKAEGLWLMGVCDWLEEKKSFSGVILPGQPCVQTLEVVCWTHLIKEKWHTGISLDPLSISHLSSWWQ